ncbi:MAG: ABC transporter ATP-binding protein [Methylococcaceae bacterium]|nr:MAG: ABC transporter ATP-binding protein [Methylococcaceae bacterium]
MPSNPPRFDWSYFRRIAAEHRRQLWAGHLIAVLATVASVPVPLFMPLLVDEVLLHKPAYTVALIDSLTPAVWHGPLLYIGAVLFLTLLLRAVATLLNVWQIRQFAFIAKDAVYRMRVSLLQHLCYVSMAEYESLGGAAVAARLVTDLDNIDKFFGDTLGRLLVSILTIAGTAAVLLWMHWQLGLFILLLNPLVVYFTQAMGKRVKQLKKSENSAIEAFQLALTETLDAIQQVRACNRENHYLSRLVVKAGEVREHSAAFAWRSDAASRLSYVVFLFGFDVFRATSMLMVFYSGLSLGEMLAVFGYLWFMMSPVQDVLNIQYALFAAKAALGRVNQLAELQQEPHYPHHIDPFRGKRTVGIHVQDLHFAYPNGHAVLNGVSLDIRPGEKVALVGASGGGKSTLVQTLIGLYPPTSGMIYYDGAPLDQVGLEVVREHVVTVLQHPLLFNATVRENLTLGRRHGDAALWRALEIAQLRDAIADCAAGLDTIVGQAGMRLSGGQRQRLAIARMVLAEPAVVILDEATSALDTATEQRLHAALAQFLEGRTTLIVAHRLSAVKQADRVYVFEDGQICEQGDHHSLIAAQGLYAKLYGEHAVAAETAYANPTALSTALRF